MGQSRLRCSGVEGTGSGQRAGALSWSTRWRGHTVAASFLALRHGENLLGFFFSSPGFSILRNSLGTSVISPSRRRRTLPCPLEESSATILRAGSVRIVSPQVERGIVELGKVHGLSISFLNHRIPQSRIFVDQWGLMPWRATSPDVLINALDMEEPSLHLRLALQASLPTWCTPAPLPSVLRPLPPLQAS